MTVYTYTMTSDTGFALAVKDGILSMACCITQLRYSIARAFLKGDKEIYLIGFCGKGLQASNKDLIEDYYPVYIAKITRVVSTKEYFTNNEFVGRPDRVYEWKDGEFVSIGKEKNPHDGDPAALIKDMYFRRNESIYNYVLLSDEFVYFGDNQNAKLPYLNEVRERRENAYWGKGKAKLSEADQKQFLEDFQKRSIEQKQKKRINFISRKKGTCSK